MGKIDDAVQVLARVAIGIPVGGQVPTTVELATRANTAQGTVQAALGRLEESGALRISSHGSRGRRVVSRDISALWLASAGGALTGVMPLPDSREFSGLATALSDAAESRGIPLQLLFRQGSTVRLQFLESGRVDFTVASATVAHSQPGQTASLTLAPHTYYQKDSVVVITASGREVGTPDRVPVDRSSHDHLQLTQSEFPNAQLVDAPYSFIPELVVSGEFDAAVWHRSASSPLLIGSGITIHPLRHRKSDAADSLDRAAIVWRSQDTAVGGVMSDVFTAARLEKVQQEVMDGVRIPQF